MSVETTASGMSLVTCDGSSSCGQVFRSASDPRLLVDQLISAEWDARADKRANGGIFALCPWHKDPPRLIYVPSDRAIMELHEAAIARARSDAALAAAVVPMIRCSVCGRMVEDIAPAITSIGGTVTCDRHRPPAEWTTKRGGIYVQMPPGWRG